MLPFAIGACEAFGGNIYTEAFGIVALVAMTPVITLQLFGLAYAIKSKKAAKEVVIPDGADTIIELDYFSSDQDLDDVFDEAPIKEDENHDRNNLPDGIDQKNIDQTNFITANKEITGKHSGKTIDSEEQVGYNIKEKPPINQETEGY